MAAAPPRTFWVKLVPFDDEDEKTTGKPPLAKDFINQIKDKEFTEPRPGEWRNLSHLLAAVELDARWADSAKMRGGQFDWSSADILFTEGQMDTVSKEVRAAHHGLPKDPTSTMVFLRVRFVPTPPAVSVGAAAGGAAAPVAGSDLTPEQKHEILLQFIRDNFLETSGCHSVLDRDSMTLTPKVQTEALASLFKSLMKTPSELYEDLQKQKAAAAAAAAAAAVCADAAADATTAVVNAAAAAVVADDTTAAIAAPVGVDTATVAAVKPVYRYSRFDPAVVLCAGPGWGKSFTVDEIARKTERVKEVASTVTRAGETFWDLLEPTTTIPITFNNITTFIGSKENPAFSLIVRILYSYCRGDDRSVPFEDFHERFYRRCGVETTYHRAMQALYAHLRERGRPESVFLLVDEVVKANGIETHVEDFSNKKHPMWVVIRTLFDYRIIQPDPHKYLVMITALDYVTLDNVTLSGRPIAWSKALKPLLAPEASFDEIRALLHLEVDDATMERAWPLILSCGGNPRYLAMAQGFINGKINRDAEDKKDSGILDFIELAMDSPTAIMKGIASLGSYLKTKTGSLPFPPESALFMFHVLAYPRRLLISHPCWPNGMSVSQLHAQGNIFGHVSNEYCVPYLPFMRVLHLKEAWATSPSVCACRLEVASLLESAVSKGSNFELLVARLLHVRCVSLSLLPSTTYSMWEFLFAVDVDARNVRCQEACKVAMQNTPIDFQAVRKVVYLDCTSTEISGKVPFTEAQHDCILILHYGESNPGFDVLVLFPSPEPTEDAPFVGIAINTKVQVKTTKRDLVNISKQCKKHGADWLVNLLPGIYFCLLNCGEHSINVESEDVGDRSLTVDKEALEAFFGPTLFNGPAFFSVRHPTGRPQDPVQKKPRMGSDSDM